MGKWYAKKKKYIAAEEFFYKAREFDLLISIIETDRGTSLALEHKENIIKYLTDCPSSVKFLGTFHILIVS